MPRLLALLACAALAGCGREAGAVRVPVCPAAGTVVLDGKPAAGALLVFHPAGDVALPALPRATSDADGRFRVGTYAADDGLPEGSYVVTVLWTAKPTGPDKTVEGKSLVNPKFAKKESSPLKVAIVRGADGSCLLPTLTLTR